MGRRIGEVASLARPLKQRIGLAMRGAKGISPTGLLLALVLLITAALRCWSLNFGLPALYDPDESHFMLTALKLLDEQTLNPQWFGHPGTTTIYSLAVVILLVLGAGLATGRFADAASFGEAVFADPGVIVLPARVLMVVLGLASIALTFVIARKLFGQRVALVAAALSAVDPLHIKYSQVVRTDMNVTVFALLVLYASIEIARHGRRRHYLVAGIALGFAIATKWPGAIAVTAIIGAALLRVFEHADEGWLQFRNLVLAGLTTIVAMIAASPYLVLDYPTVVSNLAGEARGDHLGSTGSGFIANLGWYIYGPLRESIGWLGVILALLGCVIGGRNNRAFVATVLIFGVGFLAAMSSQSLVWERWLVPILPSVSIAVAVGLCAVVSAIGARLGRNGALLATLAACFALIVPMLLTARAGAAERANDTRAEAARWAMGNIPAGQTIVIEHLAFDMLGRGWTLLHPIGQAGCVDVQAVLERRITPAMIGSLRAGNPIIDLGGVPENKIMSCRGDYAVVANLDRYLHEASRYPEQIATYRQILRGGTIVATFEPERGRAGGRTTRIVRLSP